MVQKKKKSEQRLAYENSALVLANKIPNSVLIFTRVTLVLLGVWKFIELIINLVRWII